MDRANAEHALRLAVVADVLAQHDLFAGLPQAHPLDIATGGSGDTSGLQAPFSQASYEGSMAGNSEYTAGINVLWHDWKYTATPGVPLRSTAINTLMERYLQTPARFPGILVISVP